MEIWSQVQGGVRVGNWGEGVGRNRTICLTSSQSTSLFIQNSIGVSVRVLLLRTYIMTKATLIKDNVSLSLAYRFTGSVHCNHGRSSEVYRQA